MHRKGLLVVPFMTVGLSIALFGCDEGSGASTDAAKADAGRRQPATSKWADTTQLAAEAGLSPRLAAGPAALHAAWYAVNGESAGICDFDAEVPATSWTINYARLDGTTWHVETVAAPLLLGQPTQLGLAVDNNEVPFIVAQTGEPLELQRYCGANDVGVFSRPGADWRLEVAVVSSNQAATGDPASDFGEVVGHWPALAIDANNQWAVAYKDIHGGGLQGDDRVRADLEFSQSGATSAIDAGGGAGDFTQLTFDQMGRPVVAWYNTVSNSGDDRRGIWVARLEGDEWHSVRLASESTRGLDIALDPESGGLAMAWYSGENGRPVLARLSTGGEFTDADAWSREVFGDPRYDEGYDIDLAFGPEGHLAFAYYRCGRVGPNLGDCSPGEDAAIFAHFIDDEWTYEMVEAGGDGACGMQPTLAFDTTGQAHMAWRCSRPSDDTFRFRLETSHREALR